MKNAENRKQLDLNDRITIETGIYLKESFTSLAKKLNVHPSTISREVQSNRTFVKGYEPNGNDCRFASVCHRFDICKECHSSRPILCSKCMLHDCRNDCPKYKSSRCHRYECKPYVCNRCSEKSRCYKDRYFYSARKADDACKARHSDPRKGMRITEEQLKALDDLLTPLVRKGQSIQHIYSTHKEEIPCSIRTIYRLIDENKLTVRAIDLRRKVRRKKTRKRKKADDNRTVVVKGCRVGRTYQDYEAFISAYKSGPFTGAQMDTVKGTQGSGKCLLTLYLLSYSILIVFLLPNCGAQAVIDCFDYMEKGLGTETFKRLFPVILTDNGSEFKRVDSLECSCLESETLRTNIFYCDPMASWQKAHIERIHEYIRYVIPKKQSMAPYTQDQITLMMNHINSAKRLGTGEKSPLELISNEDSDIQKLMELLKMHLIDADEVHLQPNLLK